jgi:uncharacterized protein YoxC
MKNWNRWISGFITGTFMMLLLLLVLPASEAQQEGAALDAFQRRITQLEKQNQQYSTAIQDLYQKVEQLNNRVTTAVQGLSSQIQQISTQNNAFQQQVGNRIQSQQQTIQQMKSEDENKRGAISGYPYIKSIRQTRDGRMIYDYEYNR